MTIELPGEVENIICTLSAAGYEAFIVGGCVRDAVMGLCPNDWDIATSADPEAVKTLFPRTFDTGIAHGTVTVLMNKNNYEVTTYRIDGEYRDHRRPENVTFTTNIAEDLSRRDFTVNAMAYNKYSGFTDPFGGLDDIQSKIIRGVGDPAKRFDEDALRMLRGIRFAAQLGFEIDENTFASLKAKTVSIRDISAERIREELTKTICSWYTEKIPLLCESGLICHIFPQFCDYFNENIGSIVNVLSRLYNKKAAFCYAVLLNGLGAEKGVKILKSLKFDNKTIDETFAYLKNINVDIKSEEYSVRKKMSETGSDIFNNILYLKKVFAETANDQQAFENINHIEKIYRETIQNGYCLTLSELKLNGRDLIGRGITDGKLIGDILKYSLDQVLMHPELNERDALLDLINMYNPPA